MKSIIVAAPHSGSGKTTVTLGIMECFKRRGLAVAPFKVGPDFIDPGYHRLVCGRPSINLDGWMCGEGFVRETFAYHTQDADIAVIEGVMGLFDGIGGTSDAGSTAEIARLIGAPVILVVDAKSQARSAAALVSGFAGFDARVNIAGVIFNNVGSDNHGRVLREAVETSLPAVKVLGCIPRDEKLLLPSRHLGLVTVEENPLTAEFLERLAVVVEQRVDVNEVVNVGASLCGCPKPGRTRRTAPTESQIRIAVARDEAFCFVYDDNLRLLREAGAEIVEFSPLADEKLPEWISGIYLPGGYPELFADRLAANDGIKRAVREAIEAGMPVYAECGGLIYLTQGVVSDVGAQHGVRGQALTFDKPVKCQGLTPLVGIFPVTIRMLPKRKALGYREVELSADSIFGPAGRVARGHEFHYSEIGEMPSNVERLYRVSRQGQELGMEGYRYRNCLATYVHLHFGSNPAIALSFVEHCRNYDKRSLDR